MGKSRSIQVVKAWNPKKAAKVLAAVYFAVVMIRFLLALLTSAYPQVFVDEFLYYSLARSIATGEGLLFRGQSADYLYILYPLILSPVYMIFSDGIHLYRLLQLWNIFLMTLSLFPAYALAKAMLKDPRKALGAASVILILPDFALGQVLMSESIIYPVFFTLMFLIFRYLREKRLRDMVLIGVMGGLLFSAKPGQLVPAVAAMILLLFFAIRDREKKRVFHVLTATLCAAAVIVFFFAIAIYGFDGQASFFSVYEAQITMDPRLHLNVFLWAVAIYVYYFILACGILCFLMPLTRIRSLAELERRLLAILLVSLGGMILGSAWVVNRVEYGSGTINMRYIAMYVPMMYLLTLSSLTELNPLSLQKRIKPTLVGEKGPGKWVILVVLGYVMLCTLFLGVGAGTSVTSSYIAHATLALVNKLVLPNDRQSVGAFVVLAYILLTYIFIRKPHHARIREVCTWSLVILMLMNNAACYYLQRDETDFFNPQKTQTILNNLGDMDYLGIISDERAIEYFSILDVSSKKNTCYIFLYDLFNHTSKSGGIYEPFIPEPLRGTLPDRLTPNIDIFIMGAPEYNMMKLSPETAEYVTENENIYMIKIPKGKQWVDSMLGGVNNYLLEAGKNGVLLIFDNQPIFSPLKVKLDIYSREHTNMTIFSRSGESYTAEIAAGRNWHEFTFINPQDAYNFQTDGAPVNIFGYELTSGEK